MESRWEIPPFRGKIAKNKKNSDSSENSGFSDDNEDIGSKIYDLKPQSEKNFENPEINEEEKFSKLEKTLSELKESHKISLKTIEDEKLKLSKQLNSILLSKTLKPVNLFNLERINTQKQEINKIKKENSEIRQEIDQITEKEENLYFALQHSQQKLKSTKEDFITKEKEIQLYNIEYKTQSKDLKEINNFLHEVNKLERLKNSLIKDFIQKLKKKSEISQGLSEANVISSIQSAFRILKFQLADIDKEIISISSNNLIRSSLSLVSNIDNGGSYEES